MFFGNMSKTYYGFKPHFPYYKGYLSGILYFSHAAMLDPEPSG
jgi:hypothetical protein